MDNGIFASSSKRGHDSDFTSQPQFANAIIPSLDSVFGQGPSFAADGFYQHDSPMPSTSTAPDPSAYSAWQPLRESLPPVVAGSQPRQSSYYPVRPSPQNTLEMALAQDAPLVRSRPPSRAQESHPGRSFGVFPASRSNSQPNAAALAAQNAALFAAQRAQQELQASTSAKRADTASADELNALLQSISQSQAGPSVLAADDRNERAVGGTYGAYPSQWDFIAQPDSYASEPRGTYTPSYDSLSLAADDGDSLFGVPDRFRWRSHSDIGSEDALSVLNSADCTPAMSDHGDAFEGDAAGGIPLFGANAARLSTLKPEQQPSRSDTMRMSAENAGHGLDGAAGTASSLTGEELHASPPPDQLAEPSEEEDDALSPSLRPFSISTQGTSPIQRGNSLPKLEIPTGQSNDATMSPVSGQETAQPQTARPGGRPSAEVEKLLQQLTSQGQSQAAVPAFSFVPATPADAMSVAQAGAQFYGDGRPPNRQRSLSDAAAPQQWSGIDPRMLAGTEYLNESALSDDEDVQSHDSSAGPRRRSAASNYASPYLGAQQLREQHRAASEEPISPASGMRRALSHNLGHRRNAYSEDFGMPVNQEYMPQFFQDHAVVPSFEGQLPHDMDMSAYQAGFIPLPVPGMNDLSAVPRHVRSISRASSHGSSPGSISSDAYSETGGEIVEDPVHWDSQTTIATKQAAAARRKPGTEAKFVCDYCGETFTRQYNLKGHLRAHNGEKPFACEFPGCDKAFARAHDRQRHMQLHSNLSKYRCNACGRAFKRLDALQRHHKSDAGQHCVAKLMSDGEMPPFPTRTQTQIL